jgi:hypothetical protein
MAEFCQKYDIPKLTYENNYFILKCEVEIDVNYCY